MAAVAKHDIQHSLSLITNLSLRQWGRELVIEGLDDPMNRHSRRLVFQDCRAIHWSNYEDADLETEADVIGFCIGEGDFQEPALITTDLFELSVLYRLCEVETPTKART